MAKVEKVILVDDLDGGPADETVRFGLDGAEYELDLSKKNAAQLRDSLSKYTAKGRKASRRGRARGANRASASVDREQNQAIRVWAKKKGFQVSDRGRIPADVVEKYHASNG